MGLLQERSQEKESTRQRRVQYAKQRAQLGFKDKSTEEGVDDKVIENLEWNSKQYLQQIEEQKERKPVKLVTEVRGISKEEIEELKLAPEEKFRPV